MCLLALSRLRYGICCRIQSGSPRSFVRDTESDDEYFASIFFSFSIWLLFIFAYGRTAVDFGQHCCLYSSSIFYKKIFAVDAVALTTHIFIGYGHVKSNQAIDFLLRAKSVAAAACAIIAICLDAN